MRKHLAAPRLRWLPSAALFTVCCWFLFRYPDVCAEGVRNGLTLCGTLVLPALFPFLAVSVFLLRSGLLQLFGQLVSAAPRRMFRLPGESAGVILMALVGGFPVGASMTAQLYKDERLTQPQARRMCLFCMNPGPAFVLSTVGAGIYHSMRAGAILYASACLSSLCMGAVLACFSGEAPPARETHAVVRLTSPMAALADAVRSSTESMLQICAWVILFSTVHACVLTLPMPAQAQVFLSCFLEITSGVRTAAGALPMPAVAALISFGGLAVHCQILPYLQACGVRLRAFFAARSAGAALSALFCAALLRVFPCEVSVAAVTGELVPAAYSVSVPSFVALLLMTVLLILEVEPNCKVW